MKRILIIEDEPSLVLTLRDRLESEGYDVVAAADGATGEEKAAEGSFDVIILDLNLPGKNGLDVCRDLRGRGVETPVLMLTARGDVTDRVVGLKLGADDYLPKPFDMLELLARLEALYRRRPVSAKPGPDGQAAFGDVRVDFDGAVVTRGGEELELSALEWRLLRYLVDHPDRVLPRDLLLDEVWGYEATPVTRTVDVHVSSLRQKIEEKPSHPRHIVTVHGQGYKFVPGG
ncbi:MAG: response regulator transcription factor [Thermoanaerobaculia bacterium]|nr:response regulator transcription factor [Thermoanaerobaculia bacterium]